MFILQVLKSFGNILPFIQTFFSFPFCFHLVKADSQSCRQINLCFHFAEVELEIQDG